MSYTNFWVASVILFTILILSITNHFVPSFELLPKPPPIRLERKVHKFEKVNQTKNSTSQYDNRLMGKEEEYKIMNDHIKSVCDKYENKTKIQNENFMVDKSHKVAFCKNAKVSVLDHQKSNYVN